jgi:hypothetical protein
MKIHIRKERKLQQISNAEPAGTTTQHLCNSSSFAPLTYHHFSFLPPKHVVLYVSHLGSSLNIPSQ